MHTNPIDDLGILGSTGEMVALARSYDWQMSALGPPASWPPVLRTVLGVCLNSHFPMTVWWGPDLIQLYNDAYRPILGAEKHPAAFGRPARATWAEIWPTIGPLVDQVMTRKQAVRGDDMALLLNRNGYPEQCYFTFSYSPIRDESGSVVGMFTAAVETTSRVVAEQRQAFSLELLERLRPLSSAHDITTVACEMLGKRLGMSRVYYAETDEQRGSFSTMAEWTAGSLSPMPVSGMLTDFGPDIFPGLRRGRPLSIDDVAKDGHTAAYATAFDALRIRAILAIPLVKSGRLIAVLSLSCAVPYRWTEGDLNLATDVGERTWAAIELARAQAALDKERDRSRDILENMDEVFVLVDRDGHIEQYNSAALRFADQSTPDLIGKTLWEVWPWLESSELERLYKRAVAERIPVSLEHSCSSPDGGQFWIDTHANPYGECLAIFFRDITQSKLAEQRILAAAQHDALTGLPNRALVFEYGNHLLASARRSHAQGAFLFIDLDRFKPINDIYGHEVGDQLLQEVAKRLARCVREEDLVGRLGGDEFIVVLTLANNTNSALNVAQHILDVLSQPFEIGSLDLAISACIGISQFPQHGSDLDTLLHAADLAMYQVKYENRGSYHVYTPELCDRAHASTSIEASLKRALRRDGLMLHYQPILDMRGGTLAGVEALLRLAGSDGRVVGPGQFIPIAETAGLIGQIGEWVVAEACRQQMAWLRQGLPIVDIAINVSPLQFRQRDFAQRFQSIVQDAGVDPIHIQMEVTESTVMGNMEESIQTLKDVRTAGIKIALDDFGTGYSSLSHLSHLPLNALKVDQSFVQRLNHDKASRAITDAIIVLGRALDLEVIGEGIESDEARVYLEQHGCDQAQGFLISRPLAEWDFARWYRERYAAA